MSRLVFDISNKTELIRIASTNAWNDAYNKAFQYSGLAGATLSRALSITVPKQPEYVTQVYNDLVTSAKEIAVGNFGLSAVIEVDFLINNWYFIILITIDIWLKSLIIKLSIVKNIQI